MCTLPCCFNTFAGSQSSATTIRQMSTRACRELDTSVENYTNQSQHEHKIFSIARGVTIGNQLKKRKKSRCRVRGVKPRDSSRGFKRRYHLHQRKLPGFSPHLRHCEIHKGTRLSNLASFTQLAPMHQTLHRRSRALRVTRTAAARRGRPRHG